MKKLTETKQYEKYWVWKWTQLTKFYRNTKIGNKIELWLDHLLLKGDDYECKYPESRFAKWWDWSYDEHENWKSGRLSFRRMFCIED